VRLLRGVRDRRRYIVFLFVLLHSFHLTRCEWAARLSFVICFRIFG
jgi:hypothetical protein